MARNGRVRVEGLGELRKRLARLGNAIPVAIQSTLDDAAERTIVEMREAHLDGARKYGPLNWREKDIPLTVYIDAAIRHLLALREGQDCAPDSQLPHAAHVMAGMSIVLDAAACGKLIDDRVHTRPDAYERVINEIEAIRERRAA